ncbi:hypothetical protein EZS27_027087 [termite gut metagenome]|uniref:Uncharacterized protein n=1 Tax=termite gut metagenome TaxID=433724 RepID=A0A5J4QQV0_9ZZZZ
MPELLTALTGIMNGSYGDYEQFLRELCHRQT